VIVDVVAGDVQEHRHLRPEPFDPLELKTAHFQDGEFLFLGAVDISDQGVTDVSAHEGLSARGPEDLPDEGGHRCLSVRPRDGDRGPLQKSEGDLDLGEDGDPAPDAFREERVDRRHSRRRDDEIDPRQNGRVPGTEDRLQAEARKRSCGIPQIGERLVIRDRHGGAPAGEKTDRGEPRLAEPDDQDPFAG